MGLASRLNRCESVQLERDGLHFLQHCMQLLVSLQHAVQLAPVKQEYNIQAYLSLRASRPLCDLFKLMCKHAPVEQECMTYHLSCLRASTPLSSTSGLSSLRASTS